MLVAKDAYFNCIIYKGLHSLIASLLVPSRQPLWKPTLGYTLLFTLLVDKNGHTGQLILDYFRNISDQKINPNLSKRISRVKTNVLNACNEIQEPTPQCRSKARSVNRPIHCKLRWASLNELPIQCKDKLLESKNCMCSLPGSWIKRLA